MESPPSGTNQHSGTSQPFTDRHGNPTNAHGVMLSGIRGRDSDAYLNVLDALDDVDEELDRHDGHPETLLAHVTELQKQAEHISDGGERADALGRVAQLRTDVENLGSMIPDESAPLTPQEQARQLRITADDLPGTPEQRVSAIDAGIAHIKQLIAQTGDESMRRDIDGLLRSRLRAVSSAKNTPLGLPAVGPDE